MLAFVTNVKFKPTILFRPEKCYKCVGAVAASARLQHQTFRKVLNYDYYIIYILHFEYKTKFKTA